MFNRSIIMFIFFTFFTFTYNTLNGAIIINFERDEAEDKLRVVSFNTHTQKLLRYELINIPCTGRKLKEYLNDTFSSTGGLQELDYFIEYTSNKNLRIIDLINNSERILYKESNENFIILFQGKISSSPKGEIGEFRNKNFWSSQEIDEKSPLEIKKIIPKSKLREAYEASFPIIHQDVTPPLTLASLSKNKKANLGELLTTLTLFSFGYTQISTKYGGNKGFDGAFESKSRKYLFVTQSKQEKKERTAKNIMKHQLDEKKSMKL